MSDRPTPETDDLAITCYIDSVIEGVFTFRAVPIEDCRKLERERDEAREALKKINEARKAGIGRGGAVTTIFFQNAQGERMALAPSLTIEDLVQMGITSIRLAREGAPLEPGWWVEISCKSHKTAATRKVATKKEKK